MTWRKYFRVADNNTSGALSPIHGNKGSLVNPGFTNYGSLLPEVYAGHPNRVERYSQYEVMDLDSEVNAALDILAEFCTQPNEDNAFFDLDFKEDPTETETKILTKELQTWCSLNKFDSRVFKLFRNTLKYGDQLFVRDPETFELMWVDMNQVIKIIVNESKGKEPEQYVIHDLNINFENLTVTQIAADTIYHPNTTGGGGGSATGVAGYNSQTQGGGAGGRFTMGARDIAIEAKNIVHLSLTEGLDLNWPFGRSILEQIFKVYKQKELLEDAIIIYRVQRAPERRVFKIDTGNMPSHMAMAFVERIKNEIWQRRIPTQAGGAGSFMDSTYNPLCLDLTTKIPLLDGRILPLSEIISEFEKGKENWVYSCNPVTGEIVPGVINWAGKTRLNTEVIELTLDNGEKLVCTPDHKIPVFGKGFIEAKDLTEHDSLISFNTKLKKISGKGSSEYQQIWDHKQKQWIWTHRMVGDFFRKIEKHQEFTYLQENATKTKIVIHHKDSNRFNNDPRNLTYMDKEDHILYHAAQKKEFWENMSTEYKITLTNKISDTLKENWKNMSEQERLNALWNIRQAQKRAIWLRQNDPSHAKRYKENAGKSRQKAFVRNPEVLTQCLQNLESRVKIKNQELNLTFDMLQIVATLVKTNSKNKNKILALCDQNQNLLDLVKKNNDQNLDYKNAQCKINFNKFGYSKMDRLLNKFGYKNWKHFTKEIDNFNHKVVSIKKVSNRDTGTITIDGNEKWHNYHTFAVDNGIFVKNSINEDYFFPTTAEGRGSSVETLPGGTNLGEIDDLKFFTNKLFRGLRIPSSYLPTGPDESSAIHQDGKVGTALIQEFRFNQYCKRLQSLIIPVLDQEFKAYLKFRGVNIDSSLFDLKFNDPQNFASYRQAELDATKINTFTSLEQFKYFSRRFLMERFLGLSQAEILQNEEQWREENVEPAGESEGEAGGGLRSVGISPGGLDTDLEGIEGAEDEMAAGEGGMEGGEIGGAGAEPVAAPGGGGGTAAGIMNSMNTPSP